MEITSNSLVLCPKGDGSGEIQLDLGKLLKAESRLDEVAYITGAKAAELLSTFNTTWAEIQKTVVTLRREYIKAKSVTRGVRASILLNDAEEILKLKGLKSSADLRDAVVECNAAYQEAQDREHNLASIVAFLEGKLQAFENAYTAVKKLLSTVQLPSQPIRDRGDDEESPDTLPFGFGKADY